MVVVFNKLSEMECVKENNKINSSKMPRIRYPHELIFCFHGDVCTTMAIYIYILVPEDTIRRKVLWSEAVHYLPLL